nr:hypothetical protein [Tanacetum cinerariifolium]
AALSLSSLNLNQQHHPAALTRTSSNALKDTLPQLLKDSIKISISKSIAEELPYVKAHKELSKSLHTNMKKSIRLKDMVSLLEAVEVFRKDNAEGEKWKKNNHAEEKDDQQPDQTKGEQISRANITDIVQGKQPSAQVVLNEKAMIVHNLEEKKEGNVSTEDDSDDDDLDKQPLSKRFKIMTLIPNPIPLNTFVPKHYQKPEEQQNLFIISPIGCLEPLP